MCVPGVCVRHLCCHGSMSSSTPSAPPPPEPVRLLPAPPVAQLPPPDADARAVAELVQAGGNVAVLGAPGTGKTTLALRLLAQAVARGRSVLLLAPTRARAEHLRARAAALAGDGQVRVSTPSAFAFQVVRTSFSARPDPLPAPVLLRGAEEDAELARLLDPQEWPTLPEQAVTSRAFRGELRDLLARCGELGVSGPELAQWGDRLDVAVWEPAARLVSAWDTQGQVSARHRGAPLRIDSVRIQDRAIEVLAAWQEDAVSVPAPVPDLLVVDDYQDCTQATARLVTALARPDATGRRTQVVVLGDPDVAVETFRGGAPSLLVEAEDPGLLGATRLVLTTRWRGGARLCALWEDQADRVPVTGTPAHRHPVSAAAAGREEDRPEGTSQPGQAAPRDAVEVLLASSPVQETAHVARLLRQEHVHGGTRWQDMAVIARSAGQAAAMARELRRRGVPLAASTPAVLLRGEPASAALLDVARAGLEGRLGGSAPAPDAHDADQVPAPVPPLPERPVVLALLTGPLVGLSVLDLRRLRRRLRREKGREQVPDEHLLTLAGDPAAAQQLAATMTAAQPGQLADPLAAQAAGLARGAVVIEAVRAVVDGSGSAPVDVEQLLWGAWQASGRGPVWRATALDRRARTSHSRALMAEAAEHDLDVVTALFKRAENWAQQHPGLDASVFLDELAAEVLPSDSVAPHGRRPAGVSVLTPAAAAGREWPVVAVTGVCQDVWPDLRVRDSLTRSGLLVDLVSGRLPAEPGRGKALAQVATRAARAQVRGDERRMLLAALTRASRRLVVTAVSDADSTPSAFLDEIARACGTDPLAPAGPPPVAQDVGDLTLRGLTGELRHALVAGHLPEASPLERQRAEHAAALLGRLARAGVPGADPASWLSVAGPSSMTPLVAAGQPVRVSPSDVEGLVSCPLRWFLQRHGAGVPPSGPQALGTLVHELAERAQREHWDRQALTQALEERLPDLGYASTWLGGLAAQRARDLVDRLATYLESVPGEVSVEQPVRTLLHLPSVRLEQEAQTGGQAPGEVVLDACDVLVSGRVDRLEHLAPTSPDQQEGDGAAGQRVRLIDLKTGSRVYADAERHPQLATYRMALEAEGYQVDGAALVLLGKQPTKKDAGMPALAPAGAALAASPDPDTGEDWALALLSQAAHAAAGAQLTARTGAACRTCAVKDSCPAQIEGRRTVA